MHIPLINSCVSKKPDLFVSNTLNNRSKIIPGKL